ncbi:transcription termination/antitermination protein NusG [Ovoidimarina sediminis]|uniref:transcription termination/antitermination protein NusG n=1 Tax=Ovoidimarina sediminis TaxID=3079856 RepID=UPI00290F7ACC|nr:transcriptional activator RfaH [Rhodophyticola sp. MJ-SS7]MDU8946166.1 transcriptional activator RfaH [Rhodophyticola sp. MJ-SS7]
MDGGTNPSESCAADREADLHWFLAQLKPGGFKLATRNLARQGFETFMPFQDITRRRAGRLHADTRPIFPGYLFVRILPDASGWRSINSTYGVAKLVALEGDRPTEVPRGIISDLRARIGTDGAFLPAREFAVGDGVRVVAGPFANAIARIDALPEKDRIFVLLEMMGRQVRAMVQPRNLELL